MKQQVFYIHGGESYSTYDAFLTRLKTSEICDLPSTRPAKKWTSCLADDLGEAYEVFMPAMPNKQNAKYEEWRIWFERHLPHLRDGVILIGFSLGAMFLAKYLSENTVTFKIKALYLLAAAVGDDDDSDLADCGDFTLSLPALPVLSERVGQIFIFHSTDDFVVPYKEALKLQAAIPGAKLVTFTDKNHFLVEELPELIQHIQAL